MVGLGRMAWRLVVLGAVCGIAASGVAQSGVARDTAPACDAVSGAKADGAKGDGAAKGDGPVKGCPVGEPVPSVAQQFPFPGETQAAPAAAASASGSEGKAVTDRFPYPGEAPVGGVKAGGVADRFPYPGETAGGSSAKGSSSSSSSSTGGPPAEGEGKPALKDEGSEGEAAPQHRRRLRPPAQKTLSDDERVEEDLSVAHFYEQSGNLMGAYLRAQDAVKLQPGAADTHLALATAAEKLGKRDEAIAQYTAALAAGPDDDVAKGAKKALERLRR